jgi:hypothetical protein
MAFHSFQTFQNFSVSCHESVIILQDEPTLSCLASHYYQILLLPCCHQSLLAPDSLLTFSPLRSTRSPRRTRSFSLQTANGPTYNDTTSLLVSPPSSSSDNISIHHSYHSFASTTTLCRFHPFRNYSHTQAHSVLLATSIQHLQLPRHNVQTADPRLRLWT